MTYHLCQELARKGHSVTLYTGDRLLDAAYVGSLQGVRVSSFRTSCSWSNLFVTPGMVSAARRELRGFDVVHLHHFRTFQNVAVAHYAQAYGVPCLLQAHGTVMRIEERQRLKWLFDTVFGYDLLRQSSIAVAVADIEVEQYKSMGVPSDRIRVVPNAVDPAEFAGLPPRGRFRAKHGLAEDEQLVLYLGRIHSIKGLDLLVRAFASLDAQAGRVRLVIAGPDDGYLAMLKKLVRDLKQEDWVTLPGPLYHRDRLEAYVDADVSVLTSRYEVFGITLLEALMCGTPVVATDRCGVSPWLKDQGGYVVPFEAEALAQALRRMLGDPEARKRFGEQGRQLVLDKFTWTGVVGRMESVYEEVGRR